MSGELIPSSLSNDLSIHEELRGDFTQAVSARVIISEGRYNSPREQEESDHTGQRDAGRHVVVNAQHIGAQTVVDHHDDAGARSCADLRIPAIELSHVHLP